MIVSKYITLKLFINYPYNPNYTTLSGNYVIYSNTFALYPLKYVLEKADR